jgi:cob(I)alamin adenosyltransferase
MTDNNEKPLVIQLQDIQASLLGVGACLASENPTEQNIIKKLPELTAALEKQIDRWNDQLPELNNFILPGGQPAGAALHLTRTISRRAERSYHRLPADSKPKEVSIYLNRLADYFFQAARFDNLLRHSEETTWLS